ncbi:MAG: helix-turn-helix domain-containing protein [Prochlorococcaceae cyanobacterium]|jgi:DNA-binding CsgD family transcriptional regulator
MAALLQPQNAGLERSDCRRYSGELLCVASMAPSRLNDSQKQELVERFRQGESAAALAAAFGCSPNTVSRTVKSVLDPDEYEQLKQQRTRPVEAISAAVNAAQADPPLDVSDRPESFAPAALGDEPDADDAAVLAIDDADDFSGDDETGDDMDGSDDDSFAAIPVLPLSVNQEPVQVQPLMPAVLPESLYMLVDKTVELQAKPLRDFTELGVLPPDEEERQALQLFVNPRQAKRQCGRTQRVIKMPDAEVLLRRASYLQIKGISRLVVEGTLYALPGS